jgi:hypothetical protein
VLMSSVGLSSEKGCAGDARQKLKCTDPTSRQRGRPTLNKLEPVKKNNQGDNAENWLRVPNGLLPQGQTGRLTVGRNITLTLTLTTKV